MGALGLLTYALVNVTWVFFRAKDFTTAKLLLLSHAFDRMGYIRVEFKTDARNLRSQRALERIGATREGVLRNHMIVQGGYHRDSVYFSVIDDEWPEVKERLQRLLRRE